MRGLAFVGKKGKKRGWGGKGEEKKLNCRAVYKTTLNSFLGKNEGERNLVC